MGYPAFGKVKTITLPSPDESLTIEGYKEKYNIDLKDFIELIEGNIKIKDEILNSSLILVMQSKYLGTTSPLVPVCRERVISSYEAGVSDAITRLCTTYNVDDEDYWGIELQVVKNGTFDFDHLIIYTKEF